MVKSPLNKKIGIIGGGQLGKMMILEAKKFGLHINILDPNESCPSSKICDKHIIGNFNDKAKILELAKISNILTYEFEHIDYEYLIKLEKEGYRIYPTPSCLEIIQDKFKQKTFLKEHKINVSDFSIVNNIDDIKNIANKFSYPLILKTCKGGYDGKGNFVINSESDIEKGLKYLNSKSNKLMCEKFIDFKLEISIIICKNLNNEVKVYPLANNIHKNSILDKTIVPANVNKELENKAIEISKNIISYLKGTGIFCIEFFITKENEILVNEIAPRPHNSGHYTIEGCKTSQFENHIRAILNLPLGETTLISPCVMLNILGNESFKGNYTLEGVDNALALPNLNLHMYGKEENSSKRKLGHLTVTNDSIEEALKISEKGFNFLKIKKI